MCVRMCVRMCVCAVTGLDARPEVFGRAHTHANAKHAEMMMSATRNITALQRDMTDFAHIIKRVRVPKCRQGYLNFGRVDCLDRFLSPIAMLGTFLTAYAQLLSERIVCIQ